MIKSFIGTKITPYKFNLVAILILLDINIFYLIWNNSAAAETAIFGLHIFAPIYLIFKLLLILLAFILDNTLLKKFIYEKIKFYNKLLLNLWGTLVFISVFMQIAILLLIFIILLFVWVSWGLPYTIENYKSFFMNV